MSNKETPEEATPRRHGECSGCGRTDKALTAPKPNAGSLYRGKMYCMGGNPRFQSGGAWTVLGVELAS